MKNIYDIFRRNISSDKNTSFKEENKLVLEVSKWTTKIDIKKAIKLIYNISIDGVNILNYRGKNKRVGKYKGKKRNWKKAIIKFKDKVDISIFNT